jgi:tRNA A-37 threonylcarbamoyl transferase component Bud32
LRYFEVNPIYEEHLKAAGLTSAEAVLMLPALIVSGHPDRNVALVRVGTGDGSLACVLKREHRVPWKERLRNACMGFGPVSKSQREAIMLKMVRQMGIGCPEWVATGEDDCGRAFLLMRELESAIELRQYLRNRTNNGPGSHLRLAQELGRIIARLHNAGIRHADLYAKHVYVDVRDSGIHLIDWQRSSRLRRLPWRDRFRDLAALDATLDESVVTAPERFACLRAYIDESDIRTRIRRTQLAQAMRLVTRRRDALLRNHKVQEMRHSAQACARPRVIWRDGEALCVTEAFDKRVGASIPDWLRYDQTAVHGRNAERSLPIRAGGLRCAELIFRRETRIFAGLSAWLRGKQLVSSSVRQAGRLFREQQHGSGTRQVLAFGQQQRSPWCVESFILTEDPRVPAAGGVQE